MRRIAIVIDDKIEEAIRKLGPKANTSQFLRMAIHFYLDNHEAIKNMAMQFCMDNHEAIKNIEKSLAVLEKKITPLSSAPQTDEPSQRKYDRSKAIDNILRMGDK